MRDDDGVDLVGADAGVRQRLLGRRCRHVDDRLVGVRRSGGSTMPERSRIHSSRESMCSQISALVTTRDGR